MPARRNSRRPYRGCIGLRTLKDLDRAALLLRRACLVVLDPGCADRHVRDSVFAQVPRDQLTQAVAQVADLVGPPDDHYYEDLRSRYSQVRQFLPALLDAVEFMATGASRPVVDAIHFLKSIEGQKRPDMGQAPQAGSRNDSRGRREQRRRAARPVRWPAAAVVFPRHRIPARIHPADAC